ncbi:hypothetical protein JW960_03325 [candidate division KSB1 bacterium]|nr:hypothetical protein [candidate division KSB1 bacterium]
MKKRGVEIYFTIYLATIISFFAIEGEVVEYKKQQALLLLDMARDKIKDLVVLENSNLMLENDTLFVEFKLTGEYNRDRFQGKAVLNLADANPDSTDANQSQNLEFNLYKRDDAKDWYFMKAALNDFGDRQDQKYHVMASLNVTPVLTDKLWDDWLKKFKDEKIVRTLFDNIERISPIDMERKLPYPIVPSGIGPGSEFTMNFPDKEYAVIKGLSWEYPLFVGGVREADDFDLQIVTGNALCSLKKNTPETVLKGTATARGGTITIRGTRSKDNQRAEARLVLQVIPPRWKNPLETSVLYTGEELQLDGEVQGVKLHQTAIKLAGSLIDEPSKLVSPNATVGPFQNAGYFTYQAVVNGVPIDELKHRVDVQEPPPPKIQDPPRRSHNTLIFHVTFYGRGNRLDFVEMLNNIAGVSDKIISNDVMSTEYEISVEVQQPRQRSGDDQVFVKFRVYDTNGKSSEFSRKVLYYW